MADQKESPISAFPHVPPRVAGLVDLAYNLYWSWHPEARVLFKEINQQAWKKSIHNPVLMLREIPPRFMDAVVNNPEYLRRYDIIMNRFSQYMANHDGWFTQNYTGRPLTIAYCARDPRGFGRPVPRTSASRSSGET